MLAGEERSEAVRAQAGASGLGQCGREGEAGEKKRWATVVGLKGGGERIEPEVHFLIRILFYFLIIN